LLRVGGRRRQGNRKHPKGPSACVDSAAGPSANEHAPRFGASWPTSSARSGQQVGTAQPARRGGGIAARAVRGAIGRKHGAIKLLPPVDSTFSWRWPGRAGASRRHAGRRLRATSPPVGFVRKGSRYSRRLSQQAGIFTSLAASGVELAQAEGPNEILRGDRGAGPAHAILHMGKLLAGPQPAIKAADSVLTAGRDPRRRCNGSPEAPRAPRARCLCGDSRRRLRGGNLIKGTGRHLAGGLPGLENLPTSPRPFRSSSSAPGTRRLAPTGRPEPDRCGRVSARTSGPAGQRSRGEKQSSRPTARSLESTLTPEQGRQAFVQSEQRPGAGAILEQVARGRETPE